MVVETILRHYVCIHPNSSLITQQHYPCSELHPLVDLIKVSGIGSAPLHTRCTFFTPACTDIHIYAAHRVEELMSMAANSKPHNCAKVFSLILMCTVHAKTPRLCHEGPFKEHCCSNDGETHVNSTCRTLPLSFRSPFLSCYLFPLKSPLEGLQFIRRYCMG